VVISGVAVTVIGCIFGLVRSSQEMWNFPRSKTWLPVWSSVPPLALFIFRTIAFLYNLSVQIGGFFVFDIGQLQYFTIWNYCLLVLFFGMGAVVSGLACFAKSNPDDPPNLFHKFFIVTYQICLTLVVIVDTVLWGILYPLAKKANEDHPGSFDMYIILNFFSYNQHGINFVWLLIEFLLNDLPFFPVHVFCVLLWAACYAIFAWIFNSFTDWWAYPFLETRVPESPLWYIGLLAIHVIIFFVWYGFYRLKLRCLVPDSGFQLLDPLDLDGKNINESRDPRSQNYD